MPGRKEQRGEAIADAEIDLMNEENFIFILLILVILCSGIPSFFDKEVNSEEIPNKPVKSGRRGSFSGRFNVANPKIPERAKIMTAQIFPDFSK
jgi:hypothetical protein